MEVKVMTNILDKNDQIAEQIKSIFAAHNIFALNLLGSPGSGKTSLLEKTLAVLKDKLNIAVIEGDLFTAKDAARVETYGVPVIQINTAGGCHLDANMVLNTLSSLDLNKLDLVIIENVGNLVCPAEFNIGEDTKVTVLSITEGEDKPLKYPLIFKEAAAVILNKIDLLPYTSFNLASAVNDIKSLNPSVKLIEASCRTEEGLADWYEWLESQVQLKRACTNVRN